MAALRRRRNCSSLLRILSSNWSSLSGTLKGLFSSRGTEVKPGKSAHPREDDVDPIGKAIVPRVHDENVLRHALQLVPSGGNVGIDRNLGHSHVPQGEVDVVAEVRQRELDDGGEILGKQLECPRL